MTGIGNILAGIFVVMGSGFALVAAIGILRLPDFYTRIHAASKAGTVGSVLALVALAIVSVETAEILRAIAAIVFFFLTAPIAAHLLSKAAYSAGYHMWEGSVLDEMPSGPALPPELRRQREEQAERVQERKRAAMLEAIPAVEAADAMSKDMAKEDVAGQDKAT